MRTKKYGIILALLLLIPCVAQAKNHTEKVFTATIKGAVKTPKLITHLPHMESGNNRHHNNEQSKRIP
jgi:hypothetical protein